MGRKCRRYGGQMALALLVGWAVSGGANAASDPSTTVQSYIEANRQGLFAQARSFLLQHVDVSASLFSNWLFGAGDAGLAAASADIFLSRKFVAAFRYKIIDTTPGGENHVFVTVVRSSPDLGHLYAWALAPKHGAAPYEIIEAIDTYITKVNFPVEESRMRFTLIRELDEWYISAIHDERFAALQRQGFYRPADRPVAALPPAPAGSPPAALPSPNPAGSVAAPPTTTSTDVGRQTADAQFNATLQSFNRVPPPPPPPPTTEAPPPEKSSMVSKVGKFFGFGKNKADELPVISDERLQATFKNIRNAIANYAASNSGVVPNLSTIQNWSSLREVVNRYGNRKQQLPPSEKLAGFSFISYDPDKYSRDDYVLVVEVHQPQNGVKHLELTPYGVDPQN